MESKQPRTVLERVQKIYQDYPAPFWVLMTGFYALYLRTRERFNEKPAFETAKPS